MHRPLRNLFLALSAALPGACATAPHAAATATTATTFVVVRHAEKADDGSKDPPLTGAGEARAVALAQSLAQAPLRAAYATAYRRTQQTAAPAARVHALAVATYDASLPAAVFAERLRRAHRDGTVLIVGHSNTVPGIAAALCGCPVAPIGDDEYDRHLSIRIGADGTATLREARY